MADEAFALSPISARAVQPSEEDYDAISEAFMETSRGRWFLGEYAKRNRNADTRMVLDAVERIEQSLAAQKQPEPAPANNELAEAIDAIKAALQEARATATSAIDELALEEHLAPVRKGARVIHEISWRWREIGADSRICDLIDSQVGAIEASCGQLATVDPHSALSAAFDLIGRQIAAFDDSDDAPEQAAAETAAVPSFAPSVETPVAYAEQIEASSHEAEIETSAEAEPAVTAADVATEMDVATVELSAAVSDLTPQAAEAAHAATEMPAGIAGAGADMSNEAADAHDDAVLDLIAAEMSAPDVSDAHADFDDMERLQVDTGAVEPRSVAPAEQVAIAAAMAPTIEPSAAAVLQPAAERPAEPSSPPAPERSIGSAVVAGGLLRRQASNGSLAALRSLSQAEKIALFS
ncbi:MAG: hypothetical protein KGK01_01400 [Bradyrhizobium sp.]|uniref:hypothetical protein n=1 Tax=Bradyrhizobium sp. TaxID=376 RepID=UPI001C28B068|nr:hypothetical protein [Bradyrhizobium sp.]MBU6461513.1 hypothetical protein [Pseudomonadota bacterium]MDE2066318.1 hypothetical protein [Bradyrhizobium sp.]MDE2241121.1 hypothetical protein [Bradyrhizobium sp.]MDE2470246.1 hypothetical protein [Bradyrhizobium sp.]